MLRVKSLTAHYGQVRALKGISLHVAEGEIVTLVGANGAGKTTALNTIAGLQRPSEGTIQFLGEDIGGAGAPAVVGKGLALVPEGRQIFGSLSVRDNLVLGAYTRRGREHREGVAGDLAFVMETFPILKHRHHQRAGTLSGGEQQMLAIGRALMARPRLLLLDEPSTGLAPTVVRDIFRVLSSLNGRGLTILLVEQNARMALGVAHRGYVMETGGVVLEGKADFLLRDREVQRAYLGKSYRQIQDE